MQAQGQGFLTLDQFLQLRLIMVGLVMGCGMAALAHTRHVATGTESRVGAGDYHATDIGPLLKVQQYLAQGRGQPVRQGIALGRPVEGDGGHAPVQGRQQLVGSGVDGFH